MIRKGLTNADDTSNDLGMRNGIWVDRVKAVLFRKNWMGMDDEWGIREPRRARNCARE